MKNVVAWFIATLGTLVFIGLAVKGAMVVGKWVFGL